MSRTMYGFKWRVNHGILMVVYPETGAHYLLISPFRSIRERVMELFPEAFGALTESQRRGLAVEMMNFANENGLNYKNL
jgi:hypothetical protein